MSGVSFVFFDLGNAISGSLFVNLGAAIRGLLETVTGSGAGTFISLLVGGFMGIGSVLMFPIHWMLYYRPDEPGMAIALLIPWILCIGITSLLFAKKAKDGIMIGVRLAIGYIVFGSLIYIGLTYILGAAGAGNVGSGVINGIFAGLTDLHPILSLILACLEGCLIGGAFGALIGALKFDPTKQDYEMKPKKVKSSKKSKKTNDEFSDMSFTYGAQSSDGKPTKTCPHCGASIKEGVTFCIKCENYL
ncbi:zinc ribbon domain-containing protein [Candidatus Lokiarchaeum ossiferum]